MKLRLLILAFLFCFCSTLWGQVSPQIQGTGAPSNPCTNGGQDYVDTTNHVLYTCPSSGSNWANRGIGQIQANTATTAASGAPAGNCQATTYYYVNTTNGDLYDCPTPGSAWVKTGNSGATTNSATFNNGGSGAASGATFNGSSAVTVSYNTLGAAPTASPTFTGTVTLPDATTNASGGWTFGTALTLPANSVATTPSTGDNSTKVATTAYVNSLIQTQTTTVTTSQLNSAPGTPVQILAAPGSGKVNHIFGAFAQYKFGTSAFTIGSASQLGLYYGNGTNQGTVPILCGFGTTGFLDQSSSRVEPARCGFDQFDSQGPVNQTTASNAAVFLTTANSATTLTVGTGSSVTITVEYEVITLQ